MDLPCLQVAQNVSIHGMVVLSPWPLKTNKGMVEFTYLHVRQMFVVKLLMKQPHSRITICASIDLTQPPWPFMHPIHIFHCMLWWGFYMISFMRFHFSPYKNNFIIKWMWILAKKMKYSFILDEGIEIRLTSRW
jgi:hypothetical protein